MTLDEAREAKLRFDNSKEMLERAQRVFDKDLNAYVAAMQKSLEPKLICPTCGANRYVENCRRMGTQCGLQAGTLHGGSA